MTRNGKARPDQVGLGYSTVAQYLLAHGADYYGLDIAASPVAMARHRLQLLDRKGKVKQGSVLECPFDSAIFDWVVSIGCLHHTGDMERGLKESTAPGGIGAGLMAR
ncbi:MAG TPA: class I SAM-dependent methyltransferase [Mesorhizobium sp.]|nr:class I SAM-dependent methyltransferase [Mesorhizobium sp.]